MKFWENLPGTLFEILISKLQKSKLGKFIPDFPLKHVITSTNLFKDTICLLALWTIQGNCHFYRPYYLVLMLSIFKISVSQWCIPLTLNKDIYNHLFTFTLKSYLFAHLILQLTLKDILCQSQHLLSCLLCILLFVSHSFLIFFKIVPSSSVASSLNTSLNSWLNIFFSSLNMNGIIGEIVWTISTQSCSFTETKGSLKCLIRVS